MKKDIEVKYDMELNRRMKELPEFATDFILSLENNTSIRTRIAYCKDLSIYLRFLLDEVELRSKRLVLELKIEDIKDIDEKTVRHFLSYLNYYTVEYKSVSGNIVRQSYSNSNQGKNRKLSTLKTFYKYLSRVYGAHDPTRYIDIKINNKIEIKNSLNGGDIDKLIRVIMSDLNHVSLKEKEYHLKLKSRNANMVLILAFTGIRVSELISLDIQDIDIEESTFIVTRKGGNQEKLYLSNEILPYLKDYIEERKLLLNVKMEYKDALFLSSQRKRISSRQVGAILNKYARYVGLDEITPHTLRRSFGMALYNQSKDIQLTADILGHSTTETTRRFYAKPTEERIKMTLRKFSY